MYRLWGFVTFVGTFSETNFAMLFRCHITQKIWLAYFGGNLRCLVVILNFLYCNQKLLHILAINGRIRGIILLNICFRGHGNVEDTNIWRIYNIKLQIIQKYVKKDVFYNTVMLNIILAALKKFNRYSPTYISEGGLHFHLTP